MYKLLIVDDEAFIRRGIKSLIDMQKLKISEVYEAENGKQALDIVKEKAPDIILADINMPIMNGLEFSKQAKKILPHSKIAVITGYDYFDYAVSALKAGVDDYILKPVSKDDISKLLKALVEKVREEKTKQSSNEIIKEIDEYNEANISFNYKAKIDEVLSDNLSNTEFGLKNLAGQLGLSTGYLSGKFKEIYGLNFQDYFLHMRINKAKLMLLGTDMKMYEIASATGFDDPNYFSASFKKHIGKSPSEFRKDMEGKR